MRAQEERLRYDEPITVEALTKALADIAQETTQTGGSRPFGAAPLVAGVDDRGPALYQVGPSGTPSGWRATAVGGDGTVVSHFEQRYEDGLDETAAAELAVDALREGTETDPTATDLDVVRVDAAGYRVYDEDERRGLV